MGGVFGALVADGFSHGTVDHEGSLFGIVIGFMVSHRAIVGFMAREAT